MGWTFKCFFCLEYYSDLDKLFKHTSTHEMNDLNLILQKYVPRGKRTLQVDISDLKCRLCDEKYPNLDTIRHHLTSVHEKYFFPATNGMTEYKMAVNNGFFNCHICNKEFETFTLLNSHVNCHVGKVVCETCGAGFLSQHSLLKHKESHMIERFSCKQCDKVFFKRSQLKYHREIVHKGKDRVRLKKCPQCPETFKEHYSKMAHLKEAHGVKMSFHCFVCRTVFSTRRALTEHTTRYHTEKYKCDVCFKCFALEFKLKQHMRGHTGERNFICPICKNAYMHKMTLKKHLKGHNSVFKFMCSDCGAGYHSKNELVKHEKEWHPN